MDPRTLAFQFRIGAFVLDRNLGGITHEESLRAPQPGGNTMNWIVGHVVRTRNQALGLLGDQPPFDEADFEPYGAGTFDPNRALRLEELKRRFDTLGPALMSALEKTTAEELSAAAPFSPIGNPNETVGSLLASIAFHEAYHLGQTACHVVCWGKQARCWLQENRDTNTQSCEGSGMAYDEQLVQRVRAAFRRVRDVRECKMFGGIALMYRNRMCCGILGNDLVVRVTDDKVEAVRRLRGVRPMDFTGKPLKGFVYVSPP